MATMNSRKLRFWESRSRGSEGSPGVDEVPQAPPLDPEWLRAIQAAIIDACDGQSLPSGTSITDRSEFPQLDPQWLRAIENAIARAGHPTVRHPNDNVVQVPKFNGSAIETAEELFAEAAKSFQAELSEEEAAIVLASQTPDSMVESLRSHVDQLRTPHRSRLHDAISVIDEFGRSLSPIFSVVELIVSSHPEWAAIAWGGVRLVFQLSSHYVEYFEKLAQMLSQISDKLPQYSRQYNLIQDRAMRREAIMSRQGVSNEVAEEWEEEDKKWRPYYVSLAKSLSFVYTDIMWFCSHACRILPRNGLGKREKAKRFIRRLWTPMDEHFAKVLSRLQIHQRLFEDGLLEIYSTEAIIHHNAVDKEMMAHRLHRKHTEIFVLRVDEKLQDLREKLNHNEDAKTELFEKETRGRKAQNLRHWIAAPDWTALFDAAERHKAANTGNWLLQHEIYQAWVSKEIPESDYDMFSKQLLFISGKPGYGKTILSTSLIADLRKRFSKDALAFFHFNMQHSHLTSSASALRSVLTQILHAHKEDPNFLDLAAIIMDDVGSGQTIASEKEVQSILRIFLGRLGQSYLIFDALDECLNWEEFLESLEEITRGIGCKVVILCRPHLRFTQVTRGNPCQIALEAEGNLADMKRYLEPNIQRLWDRGKISKTLSVAEVSSKIADRANSMFLWAVLMAGYLASPLLTPNDRLEAINNMKMLEGLDAMFKKVLEDLQHRIPRKEWSKILKMFQWLIVAQRPWSVEMLRTALAVQSNRKTTADDYIADFEESLLQTCGSFVEISQDGKIGFIHLSVKEFLTIFSPECHNSEVARSFHVQKEVADCSMATLCLSYITYNVPHGPMSGCESKPADWTALESEYALLHYATKWWPVHVSQGLPSPKSDISVYPEGCVENMCRAMTPIISNKKLLTSWIEASWVFQCPPSLGSLTARMSAFVNICPSSYKLEVSAIVDKLKRLSLELGRLNCEWGHILRTEPNEIWLPSINAIGKFNLWIGTEDANLRSLTSESDEGSMLIASQVSLDGTKVGMLKLWPSCDVNSNALEVDNVLPGPTTWKVEYQIWSLETATQIQVIKFEIPHNQLQLVKSDQFRFPVAFSSSLYLIIVQGILLKIRSSASASSDESGHFQILPPPACQHMLDYNALAMNVSMSFYERKYSFQRAPKPVLDGHKCHTWSQYMLSPNERYLIQIIGDGPPCETVSRRWIMSVYENSSTNEDVPSFTLRASVGVQFRKSLSRNNKVERYMCFHPSQPIVAVCKLTTISIWHFLERDSELVQVYPELLDNMNWSQCGKFLHGTSPLTGQPVFVNLSSYTSPPVLSLTSKAERIPEYSAVSTDLLATDSDTQSLSKETNSQILTLGMPTLTARSDTAQFSMITQDEHRGNSAVVLQSMDCTGTITEHTLVRLPKSKTIEQSYSTLVRGGDNEQLRLVLNMATQETYSVSEKADFSLPAIFDRKSKSIPVVESKKRIEWTGLLENGGAIQGPDHKKLRIE